MAGVADIAALDIAADPDEIPSEFTTLRERLLRCEEASIIFFVSVVARSILTDDPNLDSEGSIASLAVAEEPDELMGQGDDTILLLSDGEWCGRPDDFGAAHQEADPIVVNAGSIREEIPYKPWTGRRAVRSVGRFEIANDDGAYDDWQFENAIDGGRVTIQLGLQDGYSHDRILVASALGRSMRAGLRRGTFELQNIGDLLDVGVLRGRFRGLGGLSGDVELKDRYLPLALGFCRNIEPVLRSRALLIYQGSSARIGGFPNVYDGLVPLAYDGVDHPTLEAMARASVAPGFFTQCTAAGCFMLGATPARRVTADIRGSTLEGGYSDRVHNIAPFVMQNLAGIPSALVQPSTVGVLPNDGIGIYLNGAQQVSASAILATILRPYNGWYGPMPDGRLGVGAITADLFEQSAWKISNDDIFDLDPLEEEAPVWRQSLRCARNWTVMSEDDIAIGNTQITQENLAFAQREYERVEAKDITIRLRHRDARDGDEDASLGIIDTYINDPVECQRSADRLLNFIKRRVGRVRTDIGVQGVAVRSGVGGRLQAARLGLDPGESGDGRPSITVVNDLTAQDRRVSIEALYLIQAPGDENIELAA